MSNPVSIKAIMDNFLFIPFLCVFFPEQVGCVIRDRLRKKQALQINFNSARTGTEIVQRSGCQDISSGFRLLFQSVGQNVQSIVRDNTACVKKRFHQQQMATTFSATA